MLSAQKAICILTVRRAYRKNLEHFPSLYAILRISKSRFVVVRVVRFLPGDVKKSRHSSYREVHMKIDLSRLKLIDQIQNVNSHYPSGVH